MGTYSLCPSAGLNFYSNKKTLIMASVSLRFLLIVAEGLNCSATSVCVFWVARGAGVLHPRALLSDVHVCWRVGHTWPEYPPALLPSVEVWSENRCLFC